MKKQTKLKIAVTGGIGSGKSTFCDHISSKGFVVIKADDLAKDLLDSDKSIKSKVIKAFGVNSYNGDKANRKFLAEQVFSNVDSVKKINSIIHPRVIEETSNLIEKTLQTHNIVFVEAALIFEAKMDQMFDYIIVITSDLEKRIERIIIRDNVDREKVLQRMENQIPDEVKRKKADFVFINDKDVSVLKANADFFISISSKLKKNDKSSNPG